MPRNYLALPKISSPTPFGGPSTASNQGLPNIPQPKMKGRTLTGPERDVYHQQALEAARSQGVPGHLMVETVQNLSGFNPTAKQGGLGITQAPAYSQFNPFDTYQSLEDLAKRLKPSL